MSKKILIIDNSIQTKCERCSQFHRHFSSASSVIHTADRKLPKHLDYYSHIILTGSAAHVNEMSDIYKRIRPLILRAEKEGIPLMGICFGFQAIVAALSDLTSIDHYVYPEIGWTKIYVKHPSTIFKGLPDNFYAFENHLSSVRTLPSQLNATAVSLKKNIQAVEHKSKPIYGVQFHPEYTAYRGEATVSRWLKRRVPFRWFTNIHKPPRYNPEISEKVLNNFFEQSKAS